MTDIKLDNLENIITDGVNAIEVKANIDSVMQGIEKSLSLDHDTYKKMAENAYIFSLKYSQDKIISALLITIQEKGFLQNV